MRGFADFANSSVARNFAIGVVVVGVGAAVVTAVVLTGGVAGVGLAAAAEGVAAGAGAEVALGTAAVVAETEAAGAGIAALEGGAELAAEGTAEAIEAAEGAEAAEAAEGAEAAGEGCADGACEGACFTAEITVSTESGVRPIADVAVGDRVWSRDPETGEIALHAVTHRFVTPERSLVDVRVEGADGRVEVIRSTPTHPYWVEGRGWTAAGALAIGDVLSRKDGEAARVAAEWEEPGRETVYNLEVEGTHTYFVGGRRGLGA